MNEDLDFETLNDADAQDAYTVYGAIQEHNFLSVNHTINPVQKQPSKSILPIILGVAAVGLVGLLVLRGRK